MRRMIAAALGLWLGSVGVGHAQSQTQSGSPSGSDRPVVVELFTSQGCSSCPPADALLAELAPRDDLIALALHVDYWDYLGWRDKFADPAFTKRQKAYAHAAGERTVYTPQMIVQGQERLVGLRAMELAELVQAHAGKPAPVSLTLEREGAVLRIRAVALRPPLRERVVVQVVRYTPQDIVEIEHGENSGKRVVYANIVTLWQRVGEWDGVKPLVLEASAAGPAPVVVILQEPGPGAIVAAARLR